MLESEPESFLSKLEARVKALVVVAHSLLPQVLLRFVLWVFNFFTFNLAFIFKFIHCTQLIFWYARIYWNWVYKCLLKKIYKNKRKKEKVTIFQTSNHNFNWSFEPDEVDHHQNQSKNFCPTISFNLFNLNYILLIQ